MDFKKYLITLFIFLLFVVFNNNLYARIHLNGYYQFSQSAYQESSHKWNVNNPDNYFQLKFWSSPFENTEAFVQLATGGMNDHEPTRFENGFIKYRFARDDFGFESFLYSKQDRLWTGHHIMDFVHGNSDYEGIRTEAWANFFGGWWNATLVSANHINNNEDLNIFHLRRSFLHDNKLTISLNSASKRWGDESKRYNSIYSAFLQYRMLQDFYLSAEVSLSDDPSQTPSSSNYAGKFEAQWLKYHSQSFGEIGYAFTYENYGKNYRNYMGSNLQNYVSYFNEVYYNLPYKAVTFKMNNSYRTDASNSFVSYDWYFENYIEFIEGYRFKTYYKLHRPADNDDLFPEFFVELEKNVREFQFKTHFIVRDINTEWQRNIIGIENKIKFLERMYFFWKISFVKDENINFNTENIFAQLSYDLGWDANCYLEYGEGWAETTVDVIRFRLSINF